LLDPNVFFSVQDLANLTTINVVYFYQQLVIFSVSDTQQIDALREFTVSASGNMFFGTISFDSHFPHTIDRPNALSYKYMYQTEFNQYCQFKNWLQVINVIPFAPFTPTQSTANVQQLCNIIQSKCLANITSNQQLTGQLPSTFTPNGLVQFNAMQDCLDYGNSLPAAPPGHTLSTGKNFDCWRYHTDLVISLSSHHCFHAGPYNFGPVATPCQGA